MKHAKGLLFLSALALGACDSSSDAQDDQVVQDAQAQEDTQTVRSFIETLDASDYDAAAAAAFVADEYVDHDRSPAAPPEISDADAIRGFFDQLAGGFPDRLHDIEILEATESGRVVVRWRFTGTQTGPFLQFPPSSNAVDLHGTDIFRLEDGRIVEHWHTEELATMFAQLQGA